MSRLTCVKAYVLWFVRNSRKQNKNKGGLTTQELAHAQKEWIIESSASELPQVYLQHALQIYA